MTYGHALFLAAGTNEKLSELLPEAEEVLSFVQKDPAALRFVFMPELSDGEKMQLLLAAFPKKPAKEIAGLFSVLLEKNRFESLNGALEYFIKEARETLSIGVVSVQSAYELSEEQKNRLKEKILSATSYQTLQISYTVDPSLIGGMLVRIGDHVLDTTVSTKLGALTDALRKS